jgi:hypothetical protein
MPKKLARFRPPPAKAAFADGLASEAQTYLSGLKAPRWLLQIAAAFHAFLSTPLDPLRLTCQNRSGRLSLMIAFRKSAVPPPRT